MIGNRKEITQKSVTDANRQFYDAIAQSYDKIDGRRSPRLAAWIRANLSDMRSRCHGGSLLDLGTGSGLITRCAHGLFKLRIAMDVSPKILSANRSHFDFGVVADLNCLPFKSESFDMVTSFSVLHHLYNFESLIFEVSRVLKAGGIFYSDHDMDKRFYKRFFIPLSLYRKLYNSKSWYMRASSRITTELYNLTEWHEKGIDSDYLVNLFENNGFSVEYHFHWFGITAFTDTVFSKRRYSRGWAPIFSMLAVKK